jgi:hypothetical protein
MGDDEATMTADDGGGPVSGSIGAPDPRNDLERISAPLLRRLARLPRGVMLLFIVGWLLGGLFLPDPFGALLLLALAGFLGWLLALGWPALSTGAKLFRFATLLLLAGVAGSRLAA